MEANLVGLQPRHMGETDLSTEQESRTDRFPNALSEIVPNSLTTPSDNGMTQ
jgi:hypothetical protein